MIILEKIIKSTRGLRRYGLFILEIIGWVVVLLFLTPILASFIQAQFPKAQISFGDFILAITAAFILAYTYETKKMREETIYQRKMSSAIDVNFVMIGDYNTSKPDEEIIYGVLTTFKGLNCVAKVSFISGIMTMSIGRSDPFYIAQEDNWESERMVAQYCIKGRKDRNDFLRALKLQNGEIRARVLMTNGEKFIYTFRAIEGNWRKALDGIENRGDEFILVKKELDED